MPNPQDPGRIVREGYDLLRRECYYAQKKVVAKLAALHCRVSEASFSLILTQKKPVGEVLLRKVADAMQRLIWTELGYRWDTTGFRPERPRDWAPDEVKPLAKEDGFTFHAEGRLELEQKVHFFSRAEYEVLELGLSLNTFSSYFFTRKVGEFRQPVEELLLRGVHYRCFVLDPRCNEATLYFNDRARAAPAEIKGTDKIRAALLRLHQIREHFAGAGTKGKFEVYLYRHLPTTYFMIVDGAHTSGSLLASHYLYGQLNAHCPVLQIHRREQPTLFRLYWDSFQLLIRDARPLPDALPEFA